MTLGLQFRVWGKSGAPPPMAGRTVRVRGLGDGGDRSTGRMPVRLGGERRFALPVGLSQQHPTPGPPRWAGRGGCQRSITVIHPLAVCGEGCPKGGVRSYAKAPHPHIPGTRNIPGIRPLSHGRGELAFGRLDRNTSPYRWGLGKPCFPRAVAVVFPLAVCGEGCPQGGVRWSCRFPPYRRGLGKSCSPSAVAVDIAVAVPLAV